MMVAIRAGLLTVLVLLGSCATLQLEAPDVLLAGLKALPSQGMEPRFEVKLRLINPNASELSFAGGSFRIYLQDSRIASGVISTPDPVPAFGESLVTATATGDVLGGMNLLRKLMSQTSEKFEYRLELKLHRTGGFIPISVSRTGVFDMNQAGASR